MIWKLHRKILDIFFSFVIWKNLKQGTTPLHIYLYKNPQKFPEESEKEARFFLYDT